MITTDPTKTIGPAPALELKPTITTTTQRPWWSRFTERKFLLPLLVTIFGLYGLISGVLPLGWDSIFLVLALPTAWIFGEVKLDLARIQIPEQPGVKDDVARALLALLNASVSSTEKTPEQAAAEKRREERAEELHQLELERIRTSIEANKALVLPVPPAP